MSLHYNIENEEILISGKTFVYRESLKSLGARFDSQYKIWRVPYTQQAEASIQKLCDTLGNSQKNHKNPLPISRQQQTQELGIYEEDRKNSLSGNEKPADYSLTRLVDELSAHIQSKFGHPIWITAEISSLNNKNNSFFLNLTEKKAATRSSSTLNISAIIWRDISKALKEKLKDDFNLVLQEGIKVRVKAQVSLYKDRGQISLSIVDIDSAYTKGELALTKEKIILELKRLRLFDLNKQLIMTPLPFTIGLITASGSRAYSDFVDQLVQNNFPGQIIFSPASMQGESCIESIKKAHSKLLEFSPDCIVVTRGGGSQADLMWFDNLELCKNLSRSKVPIISAIGHHEDNSVLEMISYRREKTPTAAAEYIIEIFREIRKNLDGHLSRLILSMNKYISLEEKKMQNLKRRLCQGSLHQVAIQKEKISSLKLSLRSSASSLIQTELFTLSKLDKVVSSRDPKPWLVNGWTQLFHPQKKVVSIDDLELKDQIKARLTDGLISLEVVNIEPKGKDTNEQKTARRR